MITLHYHLAVVVVRHYFGLSFFYENYSIVFMFPFPLPSLLNFR